MFFTESKKVVSTYVNCQYSSAGSLERFRSLCTTGYVFDFSQNKYTFCHLLFPYKICRF